MTRLALAIIGAAMLCGCVRVQMPTAGDAAMTAQSVAPPLGGGRTCIGDLWTQRDSWMPAADSLTACPDGFPPERVGYTLTPAPGTSCTSARYELRGYRYIWGCIRRQTQFPADFWEGE